MVRTAAPLASDRDLAPLASDGDPGPPSGGGDARPPAARASGPPTSDGDPGPPTGGGDARSQPARASAPSAGGGDPLGSPARSCVPRAARSRCTGRDGSARVDAERVITELASRQYGVVTRKQLAAAGVSEDRIDRRLAAGRLERVHRGVYGVGPLTQAHAPEMAALLACGGVAALSHWSAAGLWQLHATKSSIDVSVPQAKRLSLRGVRVHRVTELGSRDVVHLEGMHVTTPARTLCDLAAIAAGRDLERAIAEALARGLTTRSRLRSIVESRPRRPGAARLRAVLDPKLPLALTRSEAEELLLELIVKAQLRPPRTNARVENYEVDCWWSAERVVAEVDGFAFHSSPRRFESDRRRDAILAAAGIRVIRVTWRQLTEEREAVVARLSRALAHPGR